MSAVLPPPIPAPAKRKNAAKKATAANNRGHDLMGKLTKPLVPSAPLTPAKVGASKPGQAVGKAEQQTVNAVKGIPGAVADLPGQIVKAATKPFIRIAMGAGGVLLILFAVARFTAPVTKPIAETAAAVTPVGRAGKAATAVKAVT
jgi:hypothetical protein